MNILHALLLGSFAAFATNAIAQDGTGDPANQNPPTTLINGGADPTQPSGPSQPEALVSMLPPKTSLGVPTIQNVTLYKKSSKIGILSAKGAEITLPGIGTPVDRSINILDGYIGVSDTAADGSITVTSWDTSSLTNPYKPQDPSKDGHYNNAVIIDDPDDPDAPSNAIKPDLLPGEIPSTYTVDDSDGNPSTTPLGSFFLDDANRIFFTPPTAKKLFLLSSDVFCINCVTHLSSGNKIVAEWSKTGEDVYHVVTIDLTSASIIDDFTLGDSDDVHMMLTWANSGSVLGKFKGHLFKEYFTIDLAQHTYLSKASTSAGEMQKVNNGSVSTIDISAGIQ